jgi:hypothetical protein
MMAAGSAPENRTRKNRSKSAKITCATAFREAVIDCVVRNLSDRGACLKVESPSVLSSPRRFFRLRDARPAASAGGLAAPRKPIGALGFLWPGAVSACRSPEGGFFV